MGWTDAVDDRIDDGARAQQVLGDITPFEALALLLLLEGWSTRRVARELSWSMAGVTLLALRVAGRLKG